MTRLLMIAMLLTLTSSAYGQERQPRLDDVMTPADRAMIVQALQKAGSPLAKPYSQGAPFAWHLMPEVEKALNALGTPAAADLVNRIEATRQKPRTEADEPTKTVGAPLQKPLTFEDGYGNTANAWTEGHGPQFEVAWSDDDLATVRRALDKLEDEHLRDPAGITDYEMGRRARLLDKLAAPSGYYRFGMFLDVDLVDGDGHPWRVVKLTNPEIILIGFAVSRDRYCRAEDQDVDDMQFLEAGVECYLRNTAAIRLFDRIAQTRHVSPGGAVR
jgi:hypothetical protein